MSIRRVSSQRCSKHKKDKTIQFNIACSIIEINVITFHKYLYFIQNNKKK